MASKAAGHREKTLSLVIFGTLLAKREADRYLRNMKYTITTLLMLLAFGFAGSLSAQAHKANVNTQEGIGTPLPEFAFELPDKSWLTPSVLPENQPIVVFYFDPFCEHCNLEAEWVQNNAQLFKGITLIWVSWAEKVEDNVAFYKKYFMEMPTKVYVARDTKYKIDDYFGYSEVPSIYVYNAARLRTASFKAETKPEILIKFAKTQSPGGE